MPFCGFGSYRVPASYCMCTCVMSMHLACACALNKSETGLKAAESATQHTRTHTSLVPSHHPSNGLRITPVPTTTSPSGSAQIRIHFCLQPTRARSGRPTQATSLAMASSRPIKGQERPSAPACVHANTHTHAGRALPPFAPPPPAHLNLKLPLRIVRNTIQSRRQRVARF